MKTRSSLSIINRIVFTLYALMILIVALVVLGGWKPFPKAAPAPPVVHTVFAQAAGPDVVTPQVQRAHQEKLEIPRPWRPRNGEMGALDEQRSS